MRVFGVFKAFHKSVGAQTVELEGPLIVLEPVKDSLKHSYSIN